MKTVAVSLTINASPDTVWNNLTNPRVLVEGDTGIERIDGQFAKNSSFVLRAAVAPRDFTIKVTAFEPGKLMVWESGMPLGLFKGVRRFTLESSETNTHFRMQEDFSGLMLPLIWKSMPDLQPSFDKFADALKRLSENV